MKRKIMILALAIALMSALVFLFTGCGNIVNVGGNYKPATMEEVSTTMESTETVMTGNFEVKYVLNVDMGSISSYNTLEGVMNYNSETDYKFSGKMKSTAKAEGITQSQTATIYFDNQSVYMDIGGTKTKTELSSSNFGNQIVIGDLEDYIGSIDSNAAFSIADEGDVKKIKIQMTITNSGISIPVEYYIITENNKVTGFAAKSNFSESNEGETIKFKLDMQMGATSKTVSVPSDLDSYTSLT